MRRATSKPFGKGENSSRLRHNMSRKKKRRDRETAALSGADAAFRSEDVLRKTRAGDEVSKSLTSMQETHKRYSRLKDPQKSGFVGEDTASMNFNEDRALAGLSDRARKIGGNSSIDFTTSYGRDFQSKLYKSPEATARVIRAWVRAKSKKCPHIAKKVTFAVYEDQVPKVKLLLARYGIKNPVKGLTRRSETMKATKSPRQFVAHRTTKSVVRETKAAAKEAALVGAAVGGAISIIHNTYEYAEGEVDGWKAVANVVEDTAKSGLTAAVAGGTAKLIERGAKEAGIENLAKAGTPIIAVASALLDVSSTVRALVNGEISTETAARELAGKACNRMASLYGGPVVGKAFGRIGVRMAFRRIGAVVGPMACYMMSAWVYQSCMDISARTRLAEREAVRVTTLCNEAARALDEQRRLLESRLDVGLAERRDRIAACFRDVDASLQANRREDAVKGLSGLVALYGRELELAKFEEFDKFMTESDDPLVI